ncbi:hypothetical protein Hypma_008334 [Hypsizygus marmoreus]|uniref:Uncharacterized protein n=1 Tax=Hypsizygus marmoreus TaxID=39966 RepID=A0A369JTG2_HYPMA|nr:hypothetical protein Hypma_008334 [Hypsizygus marmoreus]
MSPPVIRGYAALRLSKLERVSPRSITDSGLPLNPITLRSITSGSISTYIPEFGARRSLELSAQRSYVLTWTVS